MNERKRKRTRRLLEANWLRDLWSGDCPPHLFLDSAQHRSLQLDATLCCSLDTLLGFQDVGDMKSCCDCRGCSMYLMLAVVCPGASFNNSTVDNTCKVERLSATGCHRRPDANVDPKWLAQLGFKSRGSFLRFRLQSALLPNTFDKYVVSSGCRWIGRQY